VVVPGSKAKGSRRIWPATTSQFVLVSGGAVAWFAAALLALLSKGEAVATAFVVTGAPLIAAAAFYSRVRKIGKDGVELDPEVLGELFESLPEPADGVTPLEERRMVFEAVEAIVEPPVDPEHIDLNYLLPVVDRGVQSYERALRLDRAAQAWLAEEGYALEPPAAERGVDYVCRRDGGIYAFEVKSSRGGVGGPTPEALHAYFRQARVWADENVGRDEPFFRVLVTDVVPPSSLLDRYRAAGIGIVRIEPEEGGATDWALRPRDAR
jgi:hypothetical protein